MKKVFGLVLAAGVCFAALADAGFYAIIIAEKNKFPLVPGEDGNMVPSAQKQENRLDFGKAKATDEWQTHSFSFTPQGSGDLNFSLEGVWGPNDNHEPVLVSNIRVNGKLMKNGDFKQTFPHAGKTYPMNMWIMGKGLFCGKAGPNGMNAVKVSYMSGLRFGYPVRADRTYTFEVDVKRFAEGDAGAGAGGAAAGKKGGAAVRVGEEGGKTQTIILKPGKGYRITVEEL